MENVVQILVLMTALLKEQQDAKIPAQNKHVDTMMQTYVSSGEMSKAVFVKAATVQQQQKHTAT